MSWTAAEEPRCRTETCAEPVELQIVPRARDLGGLEVRRVLPAAQRQMVGPFIFFDQMGPADFEPGRGIDVRPHPHIGLATVTYLFEGSIFHRDSLGSEELIRPGDVNWMTAGRGIVHSERTDPETRRGGGRLSGIQSWVALPQDQAETEPGFWHHPAASLPELDGEGVRLRLIAGHGFGRRSPVATASETLYADVTLQPGARLEVPAEHEERAVYLAEGDLEIDGERQGRGQMLVLRPGVALTVGAPEGARLMLLGGAVMDGPRFIWWNFVAASRERIEQAKADWREGRFPPVPGDHERIPLPE